MNKFLRMNLCKFQVNYTRWLCYCHVPAFCDSLPHYDTTIIFGRTLLKSVFQVKFSLNTKVINNSNFLIHITQE